MIKVNCIGYPRIGPKRELKNALEKYWKSEISEADLLKCANELKKNNWQTQKDNGVDFICSNDFSFYDQVRVHAEESQKIYKRLFLSPGEDICPNQ